VIIRCANADNGPLAELARRAAVQHAPRTLERRAAAHLYASLTSTKSPSSASRALTTFGTPQVQTDAQQLLHRLSVELCTQLCGSQPGSCTAAEP